MKPANLSGPPPLPFAPLEPWLDRIEATIGIPSNLRESIKTAKRRGVISIRTADRAAIALGLHPALIWGDAWWVPCAEVAESVDAA